MDRLRFKDMPIGVKVAVAVAFFTAWVSFEEFVRQRGPTGAAEAAGLPAPCAPMGAFSFP